MKKYILGNLGWYLLQLKKKTCLEIRKCSAKLRLRNTKPVLRQKARLKTRVDFDTSKKIGVFTTQSDFQIISRIEVEIINWTDWLSFVNFFVKRMVKLTPNDLKQTKVNLFERFDIGLVYRSWNNTKDANRQFWCNFLLLYKVIYWIRQVFCFRIHVSFPLAVYLCS